MFEESLGAFWSYARQPFYQELLLSIHAFYSGIFFVLVDLLWFVITQGDFIPQSMLCMACYGCNDPRGVLDTGGRNQ